jgi:hypothetical protein
MLNLRLKLEEDEIIKVIAEYIKNSYGKYIPDYVDIYTLIDCIDIHYENQKLVASIEILEIEPWKPQK